MPQVKISRITYTLCDGSDRGLKRKVQEMRFILFNNKLRQSAVQRQKEVAGHRTEELKKGLVNTGKTSLVTDREPELAADR